MAVTYVNGDTFSATLSTTTQSVTIPTVLDGDFGIVVLGHSGASAITTPTGWTVHNNLVANGSTGTIYTKFLTASESGSTLSFVGAVAARKSVSLAVYRGTTGIGVTGTRAETTSTATHPAPTATSPTGGSHAVTAFFERSSTPSTSLVSQPAGYTARVSSFGTGTSASSSGIADDLDLAAAGESLGGGNWVLSTANNNVGTWTFGLVPSSVSPLVGTLTLVPTSGTAPLFVTATADFTGGTGTTKNYTFTWADGTSTGPQTSNTATHTYTAPGNYTAAVGNPVTVDVVNT